MYLVVTLRKTEGKKEKEPYYFSCDGSHGDALKELSIEQRQAIFSFGTADEKKKAFKNGDVRFYLFRDRNNETMLAITGYFGPTIDTCVLPPNISGLECLFLTYWNETIKLKANKRKGCERDEHLGLMPTFNRPFFSALSKFTGWPYSENSTRIVKDTFLDELFKMSYFNPEIDGCDCSCISSISSVSGIKRCGILITNANPLAGRQIFNPLLQDFRGRTSVQYLVFGHRCPTIFNAFFDCLFLEQMEIQNTGSITALLCDARTDLRNIVDCDEGSIKVFQQVYLKGHANDEGYTTASALMVRDVKVDQHGLVDDLDMWLFATQYIREKFRRGPIGDYQLAALCIHYAVNVEIYEQLFMGANGISRIDTVCINKYYMSPSYTTIKILRTGSEFINNYNDCVPSMKYYPDYIYCALREGSKGDVESHSFPDDYVFNPLRCEYPPYHIPPDTGALLSLHWTSSVFEVLHKALKKYGIIDTQQDYEWLLEGTYPQLLVILEFIDDTRQATVFEVVFDECCRVITVNREDMYAKVMEGCGGPEVVRLNERHRKLIAYLYVVEHFRSEHVARYQLAALCLRLDINIDIYNMITCEWSGPQLVYGLRYKRIQIIEKLTPNGYMYSHE